MGLHFTSLRSSSYLKLYLLRMSWEAYITSVIGGEPSPFEHAAVCGRDPGSESVWAKSANMGEITVDEIKALAGTASSLQACGPKIAGKKYMLVRDDTANEQSYSMIFSGRSDGVERSVCVGRSNKALVIGVSKPDVKGNALVKNVFTTVKHLRDANY